MWAMMSPEQHYDNEETGGGGASRHVYVHHVNEDSHINPMMGYPPPPPQVQPQQLPPQPMFIPMPYPQTMPMQMPMYMGGGGGYSYPQFSQQPIVIISGSGDEEKAKDGGGGGDTKSPPPSPPPPPKRPPFHPACLVSIIFFFIGSILGFICVAKIYDVFESSLSYEDNQQEQLEDENKDVDEHILDYLVVHRTVALGCGAVSILMFCIAFMLAFYAGMRYRLKGGGGGGGGSSTSKKKNCCLTGLLMSAWILFCLTFINGLIILVLAFDEGARIYPEVALCAVLGNMASWICMFSYCLLARIL